jgi:hypothetical protein
MSLRRAVLTVTLTCAGAALGQTIRSPSVPPDLSGVYRAISGRVILPGGVKNTGSPSAVSLTPKFAQQAKSINLKQDPWKMCQPVGPFRMMAKPQNKIEMLQVPGMIVMLFEDLSHGLMRTIYLKRGHPEKLEETWMGDSVGRWESQTLVVDTIGFNDRTWLNEEGAQHTEKLRLTERIRPILDGKYLEYKVTAEDSKALAKPYTYTRYYEKISGEIMEDICEDEE